MRANKEIAVILACLALFWHLVPLIEEDLGSLAAIFPNKIRVPLI